MSYSTAELPRIQNSPKLDALSDTIAPETFQYFLKGDISGIQDFIFNVKSEKAARVLNARNAYIQLYTRIVKEFLCKKLEDLGILKEFSEGGGSFFLYLENSNKSLIEIKNVVKEAEREANAKGMLDDLYMVLSVVEYSEKNDFKQYWKAIHEASEKDKLRKFFFVNELEKMNLQDKEIFNPFKPYPQEDNKYDWIGFAHEFAKRNIKQEDFTSEEKKQIELLKTGQIELIETKPAVIFKTRLESLFTCFQMSERMPADVKDKITDSFYNKNSFYKDKIQNKLPEWHKKLYAAYKPEIDREIAQRKQQVLFDKKSERDIEINIDDIIDYSFLAYFAQERTGTAKLGILRIDADDFGKLFGNQTDMEKAKTISKKRKYFFEKTLYKLLKNEKIKYEYDLSKRKVNPSKYRDNIYTIFAGGDDCFFVGGWDVILDWAALVRTAFMDFVEAKENDIRQPETGEPVTLSAGVVIVGAKFPVVRFSKLAGEALNKAKYSKHNGHKNKICLFDQVLTWEEFGKAKCWSEKLKVLIENDEKKSTLERIKRSAIGFEKLQEKAIAGNVSMPKVANLFYFIRRNANKQNADELEKLVEQYTNALIKAFICNRKKAAAEAEIPPKKEECIIMTNPMLLPIAARWAEFLTRKNLK